jgi:hypothetical protein
VTCLGLRTDTQLDHGCKDAFGVRAGASITVRGRLRAEGGTMPLKSGEWEAFRVEVDDAS